MKTLKTSIVSLIFFFLFTNVFGGTIDPSIPDSKYIDFGKKFYCIVKLCGEYEDGNKFCASAVIIDEHHILTAAHVVEGQKACHIIIDDQNEKKIEISKITIHPSFEEQGFGTGDIALGYSNTDFGLEYYPPLYTDSDEIEKVCAISGYGLTGTFNSGATKHDGKRRAGSNTIDYIMKDLLICSPSKKGSSDYTILEFLIGSGDSGGGLFIDGRLAAINSCIMVEKRSPQSKYGEESGHTRVSQFIDWIEETKTK